MFTLAVSLWMAVAAPQPLSDDEVLATVNGTPITRRDLRAALTDRARQEYSEAADDLRDAEHQAVRDSVGRQCIETQAKEQKVTTDAIYARQMAENYSRFDPNLRNRINSQRDRIYNAERATLDELIQKRLFEAVAKQKGMTADELNRSVATQIAPVTAADVDFIIAYENSKQAASSLPPGKERLEAAIRIAREEQARHALIESARQSATITRRLDPPRIAITPHAPEVGSPSAPVRVVVFTDFECPYCKEAEQTVSDLRKRYGNRVAVEYRNYPLPNHLYARPAAIAAVCATQQGAYMPLHDLMFAKQSDLAHADWPAWAASAGLDRTKFESCMKSQSASNEVDQDIREGVAAGVQGTPTFFVNGRLARDTDSLKRLVAEENR
jgi:protein-disulfide isomerase